MLTGLQKKTAQAIVNIFETGKPAGEYGSVTVLNGDTGHLTYGRSQTTLASGNLALLIHAYCNAGGEFSETLKSFLSAFDRKDAKLDTNGKVKSLLRQAGNDPVMQRTQDEFFDRIYWNPALTSADATGISRPLGIAVVYDSRIHGSFERLKKMTIEQHGQADGGEEKWIAAYVETRRQWLATHSNTLLHKTVYRMDAFIKLINDDKWELPLPLTIRNILLTEAILSPGYESPVIVSAGDTDERVLFYTRPLMRGDDVRRLQLALGFTEQEADGVFGKDTYEAVRDFQSAQGLTADGKAGPATRAALGLQS